MVLILESKGPHFLGRDRWVRADSRACMKNCEGLLTASQRRWVDGGFFSFFFFTRFEFLLVPLAKFLKNVKEERKKRTISDRRLIQGYLPFGIAVCGQAAKIYKNKIQILANDPST